jgi:hypothetical protein
MGENRTKNRFKTCASRLVLLRWLKVKIKKNGLEDHAEHMGKQLMHTKFIVGTSHGKSPFGRCDHMLGEKITPVSFCPPQIPQRMPLD